MWSTWWQGVSVPLNLHESVHHHLSWSGFRILGNVHCLEYGEPSPEFDRFSLLASVTGSDVASDFRTCFRPVVSYGNLLSCFILTLVCTHILCHLALHECILWSAVVCLVCNSFSGITYKQKNITCINIGNGYC